jgi:hypothetical protein
MAEQRDRRAAEHHERMGPRRPVPPRPSSDRPRAVPWLATFDLSECGRTDPGRRTPAKAAPLYSSENAWRPHPAPRDSSEHTGRQGKTHPAANIRPVRTGQGTCPNTATARARRVPLRTPGPPARDQEYVRTLQPRGRDGSGCESSARPREPRSSSGRGGRSGKLVRRGREPRCDHSAPPDRAWAFVRTPRPRRQDGSGCNHPAVRAGPGHSSERREHKGDQLRKVRRGGSARPSAITPPPPSPGRQSRTFGPTQHPSPAPPTAPASAVPCATPPCRPG